LSSHPTRLVTSNDYVENEDAGNDTRIVFAAGDCRSCYHPQMLSTSKIPTEEELLVDVRKDDCDTAAIAEQHVYVQSLMIMKSVLCTMSLCLEQFICEDPPVVISVFAVVAQ
jgi:hypothetical protein